MFSPVTTYYYLGELAAPLTGSSPTRQREGSRGIRTYQEDLSIVNRKRDLDHGKIHLLAEGVRQFDRAGVTCQFCRFSAFYKTARGVSQTPDDGAWRIGEAIFVHIYLFTPSGFGRDLTLVEDLWDHSTPL